MTNKVPSLVLTQDSDVNLNEVMSPVSLHVLGIKYHFTLFYFISIEKVVDEKLLWSLRPLSSSIK